jgi:hypothetical protein
LLRKNGRVDLLEPVSNEMLYAMLFEDNGDGKFEALSKNQWVNNIY